mmetsp:Transcript_99025/g.288808  ORF Transcript_99025/g.288808 Transcript_99025/m.288808 type:complete len:240 (-) Transcript_99025:33-752(-)
MADRRKLRTQLQVSRQKESGRAVVCEGRCDQRVRHEAANEVNAGQPEALSHRPRVLLPIRRVELLPRRQGRRAGLRHGGHEVHAVPDANVPPRGVQRGLLARVLKVVHGREVPAAVEGQGAAQEDVLLAPLLKALQEFPQLHAIALEVDEEPMHRPRPVYLRVAVTTVEAVLYLQAHLLHLPSRPELLPQLRLHRRRTTADSMHRQRLGRRLLQLRTHGRRHPGRQGGLPVVGARPERA